MEPFNLRGTLLQPRLLVTAKRFGFDFDGFAEDEIRRIHPFSYCIFACLAAFFRAADRMGAQDMPILPNYKLDINGKMLSPKRGWIFRIA